LREPETASGGEATGAETSAVAKTGATAATTSAATAGSTTSSVALKPEPADTLTGTAAGSVTAGDYPCEMDLQISFSEVDGNPVVPDGVQLDRTFFTLDSDGTYSTFGDETGRYSYDQAAGAIRWESGFMAEGGASPYRTNEEGKPSFLVNLPGQTMTCTLQ
jgi:hypothetical protein